MEQMQLSIQCCFHFFLSYFLAYYALKVYYHTSILKFQYFLINQAIRTIPKYLIQAKSIKNCIQKACYHLGYALAQIPIAQFVLLQLLYFQKSMLTRKIRETSTRKQKIRETLKKIKAIANTVSKDCIRKMLKNRLRMKSSNQAQQIRTALGQEGEARGGRLKELIDSSKCECPICLQIAIVPIVLPCGHCYCLKCFQENSIFNLRCCLCRLQIDTEEIQPAKMVQSFIDRFILPSSRQQVNYWCRKGESADWQAKRRIDLQSLRAGDNIDVRTDDNNWRRGIIVGFLFQQDQYTVEIKYCVNMKLENVFVPTSSRKLAPNGFFTKGQYLKYRSVNYQSKFVQSIEIPEIKCDFVDESMEVILHEQKWSQQSRFESKNNDLALQLFEYEMRQWENVFQLG